VLEPDPQYAAKLKRIIAQYVLEKYDREVVAVLKRLEEAEKKVAELQKQLERVPAPTWFVNEFGSSDLGGLIREPALIPEAWRALAVALRAQKKA